MLQSPVMGYLRLVSYLVLITFVCVYSEGIDRNKSHEQTIQDELDNFPKLSNVKSSPLFYCGRQRVSLHATPLLPPNCLNSEERGKPHVNITLYWKVRKPDEIKAYECVGTKTYVTAEYTMRLGWKMEKHPPRFLNISLAECMRMIREKKSPLNTTLLYVKDRYTDSSPLEIQLPDISTEINGWMKFQYYLQERTIYVEKYNSSIISATETLIKCNGLRGNCPTTRNGHLVWNITSLTTCKLRKGSQAACFIRTTDSHKNLLCPDLGLLLSNVKPKTKCGLTFGTSNEEIFFLQQNIGDYDTKLSTDKMATSVIRPRERQKREAENPISDTMDDGAHPIETEFNGKTGFVQTIMARNMATSILELESRICELNNAVLQQGIAFIRLGLSDVPIMFNARNAIGLKLEQQGDLIQYYNCTEVRNYRFLNRTRCYNEYPVEFFINNTTMSGYVVPITHSIVMKPTEVILDPNQTCPPFHFTTANFTVEIDDTGSAKLIKNVGILPRHFSIEQIEAKIAQSTFRSFQNLPADTHLIAVDTLIKEVLKKDDILNEDLAINAKIENEGFLGNVAGYFSGILSVIADIVNWLGSIMNILPHMIALGIIFYFVTMIVKCIKEMGSCCPNCKKNDTQKQGRDNCESLKAPTSKGVPTK